jgi:hypothetical protein
MFPGFAALSALDRVFLFTGALGAVVLVVRMALLFAGGALDDADLGEEGDGFQILSIHGLSSFFMMFGLVGLALSRQSRMGSELSLMGGVAAGMAAIWVIARVFRLAFRLQSSGNLQPQAAAGCTGTVYLTIPAGGIGRVTVRINVPSTFTVGVSTEPDIMNAAAERLLHLSPTHIEEMAKEIIFGHHHRPFPRRHDQVPAPFA